MKTAKLVQDNLPNFNGHAALYECFPPMKDYDGTSRKFVVCSAANIVFSGVETYILPANKKGDVIDWMEMEGSTKGTMSHSEALNNAGYTLK